MQAFAKNPPKADWSLQDLFFDIFPEYHEQWELLDNVRGGLTPGQKAEEIGFTSYERMADMASE
jgi:hypothetical protein